MCTERNRARVRDRNRWRPRRDYLPTALAEICRRDHSPVADRVPRDNAEVRPQYPSQWAAITAVAGMLGSGTADTLRTWIRRSEVESGRPSGCDLADGRGERAATQADRRAAPRQRDLEGSSDFRVKIGGTSRGRSHE